VKDALKVLDFDLLLKNQVDSFAEANKKPAFFRPIPAFLATNFNFW
jgi:hypothetical protein